MRRLRRLVQKRSLRWSEGVCVLEGPDLVEAGLEGDVEFEAVYVDGAHASSPVIERLVERCAQRGVRVFALERGVLEKIADTQTPQPVLAAARFVTTAPETLDARGLTLVLHDLRDPGNAGTIVRSADAAGVSAVVFTGQSVDPYNPKTLRATAGSIFHLPIAVGDLAATLSHLRSCGATTLATVVRGGASHRDVDLTASCVVVVGNEASGLDDESVALCDRTISIPMAGRSESLNAGVAASLIVFEALRQRQDAAATPLPPSL